MVQIYSEGLCRRYYASRLSVAYLSFLVIGVIAVILPFFLAYSNTPSFWLKTNTYREQPIVELNYKSIILLHGLDADSKPLRIFHSTMSSLNALHSTDLRMPTLRSTPLDTNRDGRYDRFRLEITMPLQQGEAIHDASVVTFFNVKLKHRARLEFEALAFAEKQSALAGDAFFSDGELVLKQRWPLKPKGGYWLPYKDEPLLDPRKVSYELASLPRLLSAYTMRNYTCDYQPRYSVWSPGSMNSFNITLDIRVPIADVLYTPTATEVLKAAWIRYLSLAVIVYYLLDKLCSFLFYYQLLDTTMCVETSASKTGLKLQPGTGS